MGLGRWLQIQDVKGDIKMLNNCPAELLDRTPFTMESTFVFLKTGFDIEVEDVIESGQFHVVHNVNWFETPIKLNLGVRVPMKKRLLSGDSSLFERYMCVSLLLHSMRAVNDYELHANKRLLFYCQRFWHLIYHNQQDIIPKPFR